jgi:hypothetical protein
MADDILDVVRGGYAEVSTPFNKRWEIRGSTWK